MGELEQRATLRRLSVAVDTWEIGIFEHEFASGETWASTRFREMLGFGPDEYVSMTEVSRQIFPADISMVQRAMQQTYEPDSDGIFDLVYRVVRRNGEIHWVHGRGITDFAIVDGQRTAVRATGTILDVTERERLRQAAEVQELRLSEAMTVSHVGMFDNDHDPVRPDDVLYWSPELRRMCGYDPHELPSLGWYLSRIHSDDAARFIEGMKNAWDPRRRVPLDIEYRWHHPDGATRWFVTRATTSFREKGEEILPCRTVGAVLDITSTRRAAELLAQRSAILDATPDVVCVIDPDLHLVFLNQAGHSHANIEDATDISTRSLGDVTGKAFEQMFTFEGRCIAMRQGSWQVQTDFEVSSNEVRPFSALVLCHCDKTGEPAHFSLVARDLTHEKRLEEQVRQSQKMEVIGRLAGGVAHDFNNILSIILGFSDVLEDKLAKGQAGHREVQEIRLAAERAAALTRQLLAIGRRELVQPRIFDLNHVLEGALPMLRRLIDATVHIDLKLGDSPNLVKADPTQIEQVLLNLVLNARDAMPFGGGLHIEATQELHRHKVDPLELDLPPGRYVVLSVSDSGHGIPPEIRKRIFEPFFTTKDEGKGTGLGLATVFDIVEKWGGGVWLRSEMHKGTTFKVYLPATDETPVARDEQLTSPMQHGGGTILLVEDEAQLRAILVTILSHAGYEILMAAGPVEALGIARGHHGVIDLLLTDVVMPQMTGPELAAELTPVRPKMAVLLMSGYTEDAIVRKGLMDDKLNFISKPLVTSALLHKIAHLLADRVTDVI